MTCTQSVPAFAILDIYGETDIGAQGYVVVILRPFCVFGEVK